MIFNYLLFLFAGVFLGGLLKNWSNKLSEKIAHNKLILDRNKQFKQILEKVNLFLQTHLKSLVAFELQHLTLLALQLFVFLYYL